MKHSQLKVAYIGGGSRGWAWGFMSDLASQDDMRGLVALYDIDLDAAHTNETIGNSIPNNPFRYKAFENRDDALRDADFVIISILPGTLDDMYFDVHLPEQYGVYQSVGDTTGPGGLIRAVRTLPVFFELGSEIERLCPNAFVINYTNPMAMCMMALYRAYPGIRAHGCCHEVFGTQKFLAAILAERGHPDIPREDIKVSPIGINHFTWLNSARWGNMDLFPVYREYADAHHATGFGTAACDQTDLNASFFSSNQRVKMDLFRRFGLIAAAGDRHLAEFCPGNWYLRSPEEARAMGFNLTPVSYRKQQLAERLARAARLRSGEEKMELQQTGEEGYLQMRALLGLSEMVTNVNLPNGGQVQNLPLGLVVETNATFNMGGVRPVMAGELPPTIHALTVKVADNYITTVDACYRGDLAAIFPAFVNDPLMAPLSLSQSEALFAEMIKSTAHCLKHYDLSFLR